jgi:hypothetical protein
VYRWELDGPAQQDDVSMPLRSLASRVSVIIGRGRVGERGVHDCGVPTRQPLDV